MTTTVLTITLEERFNLTQAIAVRMSEIRRWIESSQGYVDSLADKTDDLHAKYRASSIKHLASLRDDLSATESIWRKLMGGEA